ncbi:neurturin-like isoform X1 [Phalacrocorax carbo]|uniref:neurturin-like isoform X1 n=3 Tax=Phalacrocorax carbo TaxID=9209 RepID=UPI003119A59A
MASQPKQRGWGREEGATGESRVIRIFVLPVLQRFNVLTCSKMKVWKFAAIASMLLSSMLSILVCRDMFNGSRKYSPLPSLLSSSRASSSSSSSLPAAPRRSPRALQRHSSLLSQYSSLLESYTEGEIRQLISALVERYSQAMNSGSHELPLFPRAGSRRKRARARHKPCALKELEVSVSELGLGYESDETVLFRYCSGTCEAAIRSYDLSLKSMRSRRKIKKEKVRARPCCRPLAYDDNVSFLDAYNHYYTVNELSAKECGCV